MEAIGIVEALGPGAERFASVGDRVILGLGGTGGGYWCGACEYCLSGRPRHCTESKGIIGTFAEYFCVWARSLVTLPDSVGDHEAPLACGGLTAYGAVKKLLDHPHVPPAGPADRRHRRGGRPRPLRGPSIATRSGTRWSASTSARSGWRSSVRSACTWRWGPTRRSRSSSATSAASMPASCSP